MKTPCDAAGEDVFSPREQRSICDIAMYRNGAMVHVGLECAASANGSGAVLFFFGSPGFAFEGLWGDVLTVWPVYKAGMLVLLLPMQNSRVRMAISS